MTFLNLFIQMMITEDQEEGQGLLPKKTLSRKLKKQNY